MTEVAHSVILVNKRTIFILFSSSNPPSTLREQFPCTGYCHKPNTLNFGELLTTSNLKALKKLITLFWTSRNKSAVQYKTIWWFTIIPRLFNMNETMYSSWSSTFSTTFCIITIFSLTYVFRRMYYYVVLKYYMQFNRPLTLKFNANNTTLCSCTIVF